MKNEKKSNSNITKFIGYILVVYPILILPFDPTKINEIVSPNDLAQGDWAFYLFVYGPLVAGVIIGIMLDKRASKNVTLSALKWILLGSAVFILFNFISIFYLNK